MWSALFSTYAVSIDICLNATKKGEPFNWRSFRISGTSGVEQWKRADGKTNTTFGPWRGMIPRAHHGPGGAPVNWSPSSRWLVDVYTTTFYDAYTWTCRYMHGSSVSSTIYRVHVHRKHLQLARLHDVNECMPPLFYKCVPQVVSVRPLLKHWWPARSFRSIDSAPPLVTGSSVSSGCPRTLHAFSCAHPSLVHTYVDLQKRFPLLVSLTMYELASKWSAYWIQPLPLL